MARSTSVTKLLSAVKDPGVHELLLSADTTWSNARCPHCGHEHALVVAAQTDGNYEQMPDMTIWFRCVACQAGFVSQGGVIHPAARPLRTPEGTPKDEIAIWEEARACLGIGAHTAVVMLCRKLIFHMAVTHGLAATNARGYAPGFAECATHLQSEGLVTPRMMPWVDRIKDIGNDANHTLSPITAEQALDVATFMEQLLVLAYELDARMNAASSASRESPSDDPDGTLTTD
jgi:hypothetical protein